MSKIAHIEAEHAARRSTDKLTKVATEATERGADAARESVQVVQRAAEAVGEMQQTIQRSAKGTTELNQLVVQLFNEQVQHNLQVATAMVQAQSDYVRRSFERMSQLNGRYLEFARAGMKSVTFAART